MYRTRFAALAFIALIAAAPAQAASEQAFTPAAFAKAQAEGKPILVDVAAWWCPVCASQNRTVQRLTASPAYAKLTIFKINYDNQKPEWRALGAAKQGTLIGFRGKHETGRVAFETDEAKIDHLLKTLAN